MNLGTKNRLNRTAAVCREHLLGKHPDKLSLVQEFIAEIEGSDQNAANWSQFADVTRSTVTMLQRVDAAFETWLSP